MDFDISNEVLEDVVRVLAQNIRFDGTITDKTDRIIKKDNKELYPLVFRAENPYREVNLKILDYYNNLEKYRAAGFENVEQYLLLLNLRRRKLYGREKRMALYIQDYIKNRGEYLKMGFLEMSDFITYREYFDKTGSYERAAYLYSTEKEYEKSKEKYEEKGVYSLEDYRRFSQMTENSVRAYMEENLYRYISLPQYLSFELREFLWKKEYLKRTGSLKGVGEEIRRRYRKNKDRLSIGEDYPYFLEPGYYFYHNGIRNFGELYMYYEKMSKLRHRYASEKPDEEYMNYMLRSIRGKNSEKLL